MAMFRVRAGMEVDRIIVFILLFIQSGARAQEDKRQIEASEELRTAKKLGSGTLLGDEFRDSIGNIGIFGDKQDLGDINYEDAYDILNDYIDSLSKELDELYDTSDSDTDGTDGGDVVAEADDDGGDIRDDLILAINNVLDGNSLIGQSSPSAPTTSSGSTLVSTAASSTRGINKVNPRSEVNNVITISKSNADAKKLQRTAESPKFNGRKKSRTQKLNSDTKKIGAKSRQPDSSTKLFGSAIKQLESTINQLDSKNKQFSSTTRQLSSTTEQLSGTTEQLSSTTEQLSSTTEQLSSTTEQLSPTTEQLSSTTEQLSSTTEQLSSTTEQLSSTTEQLNGTTEQLDSKTELLGESTIQLGETTEQFELTTQKLGATSKQVDSSTEPLEPSTEQLDTSIDDTTAEQQLDNTTELDTTTEQLDTTTELETTTQDEEELLAQLAAEEEEELLKQLAVEEKQLLDELGISGRTLTADERNVVIKLLQLEQLRGEKEEAENILNIQLQELSELLDAVNKTSQLSSALNSSVQLSPALNSSVQLSVTAAAPGMLLSAAREQLRMDKSLKIINTRNVTSEINLFEGVQESLMGILRSRASFLDIITRKVGAGIDIFKKTSTILRQTVRLGSFALGSAGLSGGAEFPFKDLLDNLQKGPGSILVLLSQFYQVVESVFSLKTEYFRTFAEAAQVDGELNIANALLQIKSISLKRILPAKLRIAMRIHEESEELGRLAGELFGCVGELVEEKTKVLEGVAEFLGRKVDILEDVSSGSGLDLSEVLEALKEGELYKLATLDPIHIKGSDVLPKDISGQLRGVIGRTNIRVPLVRNMKSFLVDQSAVRGLRGSARSNKINTILARKVENAISRSTASLYVREGEVLINSNLPDITLGSRCKNDILIRRSNIRARVRRSSLLKSTTGISIYNRGKPSLDVIKFGHLYVDISLKGGLRFSLGQPLFGKCINKVSTDLPLDLSGLGVVEVNVAVVVTSVRIQDRVVSADILPGFRNPVSNLQVGQVRPHLIFGYRLELRGRIVNLKINKLKLSGCEIKLLGLNLFSYCGFIENLVRREIDSRIKDSFPLSATPILNQLNSAIKKRFGSEIAVPLGFGGENLGPAQRVASKTERLISLNIQLFQRLASFTQEFKTLEDKDKQNQNNTFTPSFNDNN